MSSPTFLVRVDWNNSGVFSSGSGEDVTSRVRSLEWGRGRDYASQLTGRSNAGFARIVLDNRSGDYSSFNAASPIAGNILPGRPVRIYGNSGSFPYTFPIAFNTNICWTGWLQRIMPAPSIYGAHTVMLEAIGSLGFLAQRLIELAMSASQRTDLLIGAILDELDWKTTSHLLKARSLSTGQTTITRHWCERKSALEAIREVEETEAGFVLESKAGAVVFQDRQYRLSGAALTSQLTISDAAAHSYSAIEQQDPLPAIANILETEVQLYAVGGLAVLWTLAETGLNSPLIERDGGTRTFWAQYPNPDSAVDGIAVDAWTTPVATTDYTVNTAADGTGTDITADVSVSVEKFGQTMKITLTNANAADGYVTFLQARGTAVTASDPVKVRREDSTSQGKYGERMWSNPAKFVPDTAEAEDWARFHLGIYKDPIPVLAVSFAANRPEMLGHAMSRDIGDRVTVVSSNLGINGDFFIEAEHHQVDAHEQHRVTWELSDAERFSDFWVLGTSALGATSRLAY